MIYEGIDGFAQELHESEIKNWNDLIVDNLNYKVFKEKIYNLYKCDSEFQY